MSAEETDMYDKMLLIPGPTNLSKRVRSVMSEPQLPHVGPEFYAAFKETLGLARYAFRNEKGVQFVFTGSGTIGMESSIVSLVQRGDRTLTLSTGYFGKRMLLLNQIHGAKADSIDYQDGAHADPDDLRKKLAETKYSAVFITHVDTSTSISNPVRELVDECNRAGALSVVDGVCSVGGVPLDFDRLGADIVFTASQKALSSAPGAVLVAASQRALDAMASRKEPIGSYYMNLLRWKPIMDDPRMYLATPATQVLLALREALTELKEEGVEKRWERHRALGEITRDSVGNWGLDFVAEEGHRADTVTSFFVRNGTAGEVQKKLETDHGVVVARGIAERKDSVIRVGHFGILTPAELRGALGSLGDTLAALKETAPRAAPAGR